MRYEIFYHDREKIYQEVWAEPVIIVAKRYDTSDVALHKLCRRLEIPVPPRGYWAQIKTGKKIDRPPLPKLSDPRKIIGKRRKPDLEADLIQQRLMEVGSSIYQNNRLQEVCSKAIVKKHQVNPHPLVMEAGQYLKARKGSNDWPLLYTNSGMLDIAVSKNQIERSLRIYDALIKTLEELGFSIRINKDKQDRYRGSRQSTCIQIGGQELPIKLVEKVKRIEHIKTPPDIGNKQLQYIYEPNHDFVATGILTLQIDYYWASRKNWRDGQRKKLEEQIGDFVLSLVKTAEEMQIRDEIREQEEQRRRQEEQRKREVQELREKEVKRFQALEKAAQEWNRAQEIERYIEAVKATMEKQTLDIKQREELEEWIRWAKGKVEWLNPLKVK